MSWYHDMLDRFDRERGDLTRQLQACATLAEREAIYLAQRDRLTEGAIWTLRKDLGDQDVEGVTVDHPWPSSAP